MNADLRSLVGKLIVSVYVHGDEHVEWVALSFSDDTEVELQPFALQGMEAALGVEQGRRLRDIYKVPAQTEKEARL